MPTEECAVDCDCLIVGGGPAGLTAAIYLGRYRRNVVLIDGNNSRASLIPKSHNYPGFASGISGPDLLEVLRKQALATVRLSTAGWSGRLPLATSTRVSERLRA